VSNLRIKQCRVVSAEDTYGSNLGDPDQQIHVPFISTRSWSLVLREPTFSETSHIFVSPTMDNDQRKFFVENIRPLKQNLTPPVSVPGYRFRDPGSIFGATRFSENGVHSAS
jgi:hypothetical protein